MATIENWQKYINLLHEMALIEDDLRQQAIKHSMGVNDWEDGKIDLARVILFERFGVDV